MYGKNIETLKKENMNLADKIYIFDTTLRDGEQAPGVALTVDEKIQIAQKLDKLGVDKIEAGFPVSSNGERKAAKELNSLGLNATVLGLARSVQKDIDAVPAFSKRPTTIYIRNGVYKEKVTVPGNRNNIHIIGEDVDKVILTYDDYASKKNAFGDNIGTSGSSSFFVYGNGFTAENVTFENSSGPVGQAVALFVAGDKCVFKNCKMKGFQDTLYTYGENSRQYYENCYIEGTTDFIFGKSTAWFENCTIHSKQNSYITAAATPENVTYGYVFNKCRLTADDGVEKVYLGRPWRPYAAVLFTKCEMGKHIRPEGWHNWGKATNEKTARYCEYKNKGEGSNTQGRVAWSHQLNRKEASRYSIKQVLGGNDGWNPQEKN